MALLVVAGCGAGGAEGEGLDQPTEAGAQLAADGTRQDPLPLGTRVVIGDYELAVTEVVMDATRLGDDVEDPGPGQQLVLVSIEGVYMGVGPAVPALDLDAHLDPRGDNTNAVLMWARPETEEDVWPSCALDTFHDLGEVLPGDEWSAAFCITIDTPVEEGGVVELHQWGPDGDARSWSLDG